MTSSTPPNNTPPNNTPPNNTPPNNKDLFGHPKGLYVLFFTEMWERFSYYGMKALLILYLTKHFLFGDQASALIYGTYGSLVYAMPVLGGMIADRYLGYRKAVAFGAILLVIGHCGMALEGPDAFLNGTDVVRDPFYIQIFYLSLAFIITGVGFLKANISTIVGKLYAIDDPRRDGGFSIFYIGINFGAFTATLACAYMGEQYGWSYGFGLAGGGMLLGLLVFHVFRRHLMDYGNPPEEARIHAPLFAGISKEYLIYLLGFAAVFGIWQLIQLTSEFGQLLIAMGLVVTGWVVWFSCKRCSAIERDQMLVLMVLIIISVFFWALFEQAGSSLTLFTDRNVDRGNFFTAGMFQAFNPFYILLFAIPFTFLWQKLSRMGKEPSTPTKFGLGILQVGLGFAVLVYGASLAEADGKVAVIWLALMYLLHTTGELCLSPIGLSVVTKLSVPRVAAMMMGVWFLSSAFAHYVGGLIAGAMAIENAPGETIDGMASLAIYTQVFEKLAYAAIIVGVLVLLLAPLLRKRMHRVH